MVFFYFYYLQLESEQGTPQKVRTHIEKLTFRELKRENHSLGTKKKLCTETNSREWTEMNVFHRLSFLILGFSRYWFGVFIYILLLFIILDFVSSSFFHFSLALISKTTFLRWFFFRSESEYTQHKWKYI